MHLTGLTLGLWSRKRPLFRRRARATCRRGSQVVEKSDKHPLASIERQCMSQDDLVVVTRAGGFIGGHLMRVLQQRGHKKLPAVDLKPMGECAPKVPGSEHH